MSNRRFDAYTENYVALPRKSQYIEGKTMNLIFLNCEIYQYNICVVWGQYEVENHMLLQLFALSNSFVDFLLVILRLQE